MEQDARLMWKGDGGFLFEYARKNPETGEMETVTGEIPAKSIVTTSAERLPSIQMLRRCWLLSVSDDQELTKKINLRKAEYAAGKVQPAPEVEVAVVQRAIQLLQEADVVVPYAEELVELAPWDRTRLDFLLDIIRVIAWLHQYQRARDGEGRIVATPADLYMAIRIAWPTLAQTLVQLPDRLKKVLEKLPPSTEKRGATTKELASELKISQSSVRVYLADLYNLGYALIGRQEDGRGKVYWRSDKSAEVLHSANEVIKHLNWQKIAEIAKRSLIQASSPSVTSEGGVDPMVCVVDPLEGTTHHILPPPPQNVTLPEEGKKEEIPEKGAKKEEFERYPQGVASGSTSASTPPLGGGASPPQLSTSTRRLVVREKFWTPNCPFLADRMGKRWLEPGEVIEAPGEKAEELLSKWSRCFAPAPEGGKKVPPSEEDLVPINPLKEIPGREGEVVDLQGGRLVRVPLVPGRPVWVSPKTAQSLVKGGYAEYVKPPDGGGREDAGGS
jgi:DNA-binding transcriptional ArsR family regulator